MRRGCSNEPGSLRFPHDTARSIHDRQRIASAAVSPVTDPPELGGDRRYDWIRRPRRGLGVLAGVVAPRNLTMSDGKAFGVALGVTAYLLGMRHAFDADHIAAIDNTTRKLVAEKKRPLSVGFWFSLGHSTIVFGLCLLLAFGVRTLASQVKNGNSTLQRTAGLVGTGVSGVFLITLGINLVSLLAIVRVASSCSALAR